MMRSLAHSTASFLRWRLVPVRYLGRLARLNPHNLNRSYAPKSAKALEIQRHGHAAGPIADPALLTALQARFFPRVDALTQTAAKAPFVNLSRSDDFTADSPLMKLAFSPEILDVALDYYSGHCRLDKIQVLHSFRTEGGSTKESQKWHLDYADTRSFHAIMYLNDVLSDDQGPFVYVDKADAARIGRGMIVRRIEDDIFRRELADGTIRAFYGKAGESVLVDPAACYHYGSRCREPRLAIFITFSSDRPFTGAMLLVRANADRILASGKALRPDLDPTLLKRLTDV